jgi:hypothetical protein
MLAVTGTAHLCAIVGGTTIAFEKDEKTADEQREGVGSGWAPFCPFLGWFIVLFDECCY